MPFQNGADALAAVRERDVDVVVTDLNMRGMAGIELCQASSRPPRRPGVVLTAFGSLETAVAAIRAGAYDFITKPVEIEVLAIASNARPQHRALRGEVKRLRSWVARGAAAAASSSARAPAMREVHDADRAVADRTRRC